MTKLNDRPRTGAGGIGSPLAKRNARGTLDQKIEHAPVGSLKAYERRARTHGEDQIATLMGSLDAFGFINPIIVDENNRVLAGHGRWEAAKRHGYTTVPVVRVDHLTGDDIRAYVIADNRIAEGRL